MLAMFKIVFMHSKASKELDRYYVTTKKAPQNGQWWKYLKNVTLRVVLKF